MHSARPTHADRFRTSGAAGTTNTLAGRAFFFRFVPDAGDDDAATATWQSPRRRRTPSHPSATGEGHPR
jgi:hypothetical protein